MNRGQLLATFIAQIGKDALVSHDIMELDELVNQANEANREDIIYTTISNEKGEVLTSQFASINYRYPRLSSLHSGLPNDIELQEIITVMKKREPIIEFSVPIAMYVKTIGKVTLGISEYGVRREIVRIIVFVIALNAAVAMVLGSVLFIISRKMILDPVAELSHAISLLASGDLTARVSVEASGEVKTLVDGFNHMLDSLEQVTVSKNYMDNIIKSINDALIVVSSDRKIILVNAAALSLLGYEEKELIGSPVEMIFDHGPGDSGMIIGQIYNKGLISNIETAYRTKDGRVVPLLFSGMTLSLKKGSTGMVFVAKDIADRIRTETSLRESEERFRLLVEDVKDYAIIMLDPAGNVMSWNLGAKRIKGYRDEEIIGRHFSRFYPEEDVQQGKPQRELERAAADGRFEDEGWRIRKDGSRFWANVAISALRDKTGQLRGFSKITRDITERKRADEALRKSEEHFRALIENGSDIISELDEHGTILYESPSVERVLGHRPSDMHGKKAFEFIHPDDIAVVANAISQGMSEPGATYSVEYRFRHQDGTWRTMESVGKFFISSSGAMGAIVNSRDITERKRAEAALRESEAFIQDILATVDEAFVVIDRDYRILTANKAYCTQAGKSLATIIGQHCYEISHHATRPCHELEQGCACNRTFETGESTVSVHTHTDETGKLTHKDVKTFAIKGKSGEITTIIEVINDITEKTALENQLRHAQKLEGIGTLAGGIAHDFNNILSAIIGYGHVTLMKMPKDDPLRMNIEHIMESADRAAALTQSLLAFSRKQITNRKPVELNSVLRKVEKFLVRVIGEDVAVRLALAEGALTIFADAGQLEQVFMNLATNARDAMPHGGSFTIETSIKELDGGFVSAHGYGKLGTYAMISATDTGVGMTEETRRKIFEPFFTTKEVGKGTGLGLAMVYGIIKQHEGFINVYSETGKGTTFKIYLPLIKTEAMEKQPIITAEYSKGGTETILLAEDDPAVRKLTLLVLEQMGYTVIIANDGEEAITKFMENKDRIQLLLFDIIMPKMNGRAAYEEIKKTKPDIPVLFASGYSPDMLSEKALIEKGAAIVYKPSSPLELSKKVRDVLDRK
jgi:two-component system NtrC family sensor kinase